MRLPGARSVLSILRFIYWYSSMAGKVAIFRSPLAQLLEIIVIAWRHDLDAQAYYMFELYRPEQFARSGSYLTRYETKNGLFKLLLRQHPEYKQKTPLDDKAGFRDFCARHGLPHPTLLGVAHDGRLDLEPAVSQPLDRDIFVKPADSKGSKDCEVFRNVAPGQYLDGSDRKLDWTELHAHLAARSREKPLIVQSLLENHSEMAPLAGESVIAIRMITCWNQSGEAIIAYAMLRIIPKLEVKWALESELGAAVDHDTGRLGQMTGDKVRQLLSWWDFHPVTGARVNGRIVPHWAEAKRIVLAAQRATLGRYLVGWDVAITPDGPVLLEGNAFPDVDFPQRTHRCGIGDSLLGPPLHDHLLELRRKIEASQPVAARRMASRSARPPWAPMDDEEDEEREYTPAYPAAFLVPAFIVCTLLSEAVFFGALAIECFRWLMTGTWVDFTLAGLGAAAPTTHVTWAGRALDWYLGLPLPASACAAAAFFCVLGWICAAIGGPARLPARSRERLDSPRGKKADSVTLP